MLSKEDIEINGLSTGEIWSSLDRDIAGNYQDSLLVAQPGELEWHMDPIWANRCIHLLATNQEGKVIKLHINIQHNTSSLADYLKEMLGRKQISVFLFGATGIEGDNWQSRSLHQSIMDQLETINTQLATQQVGGGWEYQVKFNSKSAVVTKRSIKDPILFEVNLYSLDSGEC